MSKKDIELTVEIAFDLLEQGDYQQALGYLEAGLEESADHKISMHLYLELAKTHYRLSNQEAALEAIDSALEHSKNGNSALRQQILNIRESISSQAQPEEDRDSCGVEPYSRCPIFGVAAVLGTIKDAAILVHGPRGCAYPAFEALMTEMIDIPLTFSRVGEKEIIHGGESGLKTEIKNVLEEHNPAVLAVLTTCAVDIIGDDISGVVADSNMNGTKTVVVECGGFRGGVTFGVEKALKQVVEDLTTDKASEGDSLVARMAVLGLKKINLIANVGESLTWKWDTLEIKRLLSLLGVKINTVIGYPCSSREIGKAGQADLNVLVSPEIGREAAIALQKKFGVPYVAPHIPIGLDGTNSFLREIGAALDLQKQAEEIIKAEEGKVRAKIWNHFIGNMLINLAVTLMKDMHVAIVGSSAYAIGLARFITQELEMKPTMLGLTTPFTKETRDNLDDLIKGFSLNPLILEQPDISEVRKAVFGIKPHFLFGGEMESRFVQELGVQYSVRFGYPSYDSVIVNERSYMGYTGVLVLFEQIINEILMNMRTRRP